MEKAPYSLAANRSSNADFRATPQDLYNDLGETYEDASKNNEAQIRSLKWLKVKQKLHGLLFNKVITRQ